MPLKLIQFRLACKRLSTTFNRNVKAKRTININALARDECASHQEQVCFCNFLTVLLYMNLRPRIINNIAVRTHSEVSAGFNSRLSNMFHQEFSAFFFEKLGTRFFWEGFPQLQRQLYPKPFFSQETSPTSVLTRPGETTLTRVGCKSMANERPTASTDPAAPAMSDQPGAGLRNTEPMVSLLKFLVNTNACEWKKACANVIDPVGFMSFFW
jgi:hypothetical protein